MRFWKFLVVCLIVMGVYSCNTKPSKHELLVSFDSEYLRDPTEDEFNEGFDIKPFLTDSLSNDTLFVKYVFLSSGCMDFDGNIEIANDSLFLDYWHNNEVACDEIVFYKLTYKISPKRSTNYSYRIRRIAVP